MEALSSNFIATFLVLLRPSVDVWNKIEIGTIFSLCSSEDLERLEWKKGNFCSFFFGQGRTAVFSPVFLIVGEKPKH